MQYVSSVIWLCAWGIFPTPAEDGGAQPERDDLTALREP